MSDAHIVQDFMLVMIYMIACLNLLLIGALAWIAS